MYGDQAARLVLDCRNSEATGSLKPYNDSLVRLILLETRQLSQSLSSILATLPPGLDPTLAAEKDLALGAQLLTLHHAVQRNKRCLLAYHEHRANWLKRKLWEKGGGLALMLEEKDNTASAVGSSSSSTDADRSSAASATLSSSELRSRLSPHEINWLRSYADLVTAYKAEFLDIVDVAGPLTSRSASGAGGGQRQTAGGAGSSSGPSSSGTETSGRGGGASSCWYGPPLELMVTVVATRDARDVMTEMGTLNLRRGERMRVKRQEVEGLIVRGWLDVVDD
ncbi:unnamed protein product [Parajaminaea phylloscopi]